MISLRTTVVAIALLGSISLLASPGVTYAGSDTPTVDAAKKEALDKAAAESLTKQRTLVAAKNAEALELRRVDDAAKKMERGRTFSEAAANKVAEKARIRAVHGPQDVERERGSEAPRRLAAQQNKQAQETISVELTVIQASKDGIADPKLATLQNEISRSFKGYKGFTLIETHAFQIKHADSAVKRLKNGKAVVFSNMGKEGSKLRVRLDIDGANVMMNVREGELWFHARREKGTKALILAVRAQSAGN